MYLLLVGLIVLASVLMCFVVLIQNSKGGGLASSFASSNQIMGVRKTTDFIEKLTWGLAVFMVVLSVAAAYVLPSATQGSSVIMDQAVQEQKTNPLNAPRPNKLPHRQQQTQQPNNLPLIFLKDETQIYIHSKVCREFPKPLSQCISASFLSPRYFLNLC